MPERVLVFCRRRVGLSAAELERALRDADLFTRAESLELPEGEEAAVETMWRSFRIEQNDDGFSLHWHSTQRPILVRQGPPLDGELDETLEALPSGPADALARVRDHLTQTVEIIEFEMGLEGSLHLAATLSEVLAFFWAMRGDGLVWFYRREFAAPENRATALLLTE